VNNNINCDTKFSRENHLDISLVLVLLITALVLSITFFRPNYLSGGLWYKFHHLSKEDFSFVIKYIFATSFKHFYPLIRMLFFVELRLFGLHHNSYYIINILIHLTVTGCFYKFLKFHIDDRWAVFFLTLFFSINPAFYPGGIGAGSVYGGQYTMLAQLFLLIALLSLTRFQTEGGKGPLIITAIFTILSVFSSGTGLLTPVVLLLYWLIVPIQWWKKEKVPHNWWVMLATIIFLGIGVTSVYFFIISREGIFTKVMPIMESSLPLNIAFYILAGISSFFFSAFGGKLFNLYFNLYPQQLLTPSSLPLSSQITAVILGAFALSLIFVVLLYIYKKRKIFFHEIENYSGLMTFALIYIAATYLIKAIGRVNDYSIVGFMGPDHYRYEPFLGLALFLLPIFHFFIKSLKPITSNAFRHILVPLCIALLITTSLPLFWANGNEYPQDKDFIKAYRQLLKGGAEKKPLYLWDINYTFHDEISSSFPLSSIARMDNTNMDRVRFIAYLQDETYISKESLIFYYTFFPELRSEINNKIILEQ